MRDAAQQEFEQNDDNDGRNHLEPFTAQCGARLGHELPVFVWGLLHGAACAGVDAEMMHRIARLKVR
jgi:hypothetical protein